MSLLVCVCVCVCVFVRSHISKTTCVRGACGRRSVFLCRRRVALYTSGFVDDVIIGPMLLNDKDHVLILGCSSGGGEVCCLG